MATWDDLVRWVRVRYEVMATDAAGLTFRLPTTAGRDQLVHVSHHVPATGEAAGREWVRIESPIAPLDAVDLRALLRLVDEAPVGGAAAVGDLAVLRHTAPLDDLTHAGFEAPFRLVTATADELEQKLTGADRH